MSFNVQEQEIVDLLQERGEMQGIEIANALRWTSAKLYPLLAGLESKRAIRQRSEGQLYPRRVFYTLREKQ